MDLFTYLMAKKGHNTHRDLFSYLLGKNPGGSGTYTTFSGTSLNISNTIKAKIKNFMLNSTELTQDGTPTTDTPQDIHVIKGSNNIKISDDTEEQNYPIDLISKNLCPTQQTSWEQGAINANTGETINSTIRIRTIQYYPIQNNTDYYISVQDTTYCYLNIILYNSNKNYIGQYFSVDSSINGATSKKINIPSTQIPNVGYMKIILRNSDNVSTITANEITTIKPQIEKGTSFTTYEPYYNLEYCKIGDYADQFFKNTTNSEFYDSTLELNEWYLKKNIDKVALNGSENWRERTNAGGVKQFYAPSGSQALINVKQISNYFSRFSGGLYNWGAVGDFAILTQTREFYGCVSNDITLEDFKSKLAIENLIDYYVLATPQNIHISETDYPTLRSQLENIYNNSKSYNGTTNITQTNEDLPFNISVDVKVS